MFRDVFRDVFRDMFRNIRQVLGAHLHKVVATTQLIHGFLDLSFCSLASSPFTLGII